MNSLDEIYQEHAQTIYWYIFSQIHNSTVAEELTQETFFRAVQKFAEYEEHSSIKTWLCGIAKNVLREYFRQTQKQKSREIDVDTYEISIEGMEDGILKNWETVEVMKILHGLHEPMREVIYLRLIGNLTFRQIGEIMDKSENWAKVTYYRGKEQIIKEANSNGK